ncbi:MAG: nicotinate (nicotinamide) nucleotide adenylyltransferase [Firmicutes bacterium]|nr:nicotinate (nicotinamide) nucleotide adenylyltransferase [Bacillota bacterium]
MKTLGIYGGSFDPIHLGHLLLAEAAREELALDNVVFIPAAQSPMKNHRPYISDADRLELIKLAIQDNPSFTFSDVELKRKPPSYTIDTLSFFCQTYPNHQLFLLMGQDSLNTLTGWRHFTQLFSLATLAVGVRPGFPSRVPQALAAYQHPSAQSKGIVFFDNPEVGISSSAIRERLRLGKSVRYWLAPQVRKYILENKLYTYNEEKKP